MYGLLGYDNIWPRYNYFKIWNLRVQKKFNIEKITFKVVQMNISNGYYFYTIKNNVYLQ